MATSAFTRRCGNIDYVSILFIDIQRMEESLESILQHYTGNTTLAILQSMILPRVNRIIQTVLLINSKLPQQYYAL